MADLPIKELGDEAPEYDRPIVPPPALPWSHGARRRRAVVDPEALLKLIGRARLCSKRWVWEQYDHVILGNTVQRPAATPPWSASRTAPRASPVSLDVTPRYCEADPFEGGKQAVAEAWRNLTAVGAKPLAVTDNLNFGNPERPEIMGQLVGCLEGHRRRLPRARLPDRLRQCLALQRDQRRGILPTPSSAASACSTISPSHATSPSRRRRSDRADRRNQAWLGQSIYLRDICGKRGRRSAAGRPGRGTPRR
jgi:phosphoribosylformylglycinamidine (FGAM) synthase-like enzyme